MSVSEESEVNKKRIAGIGVGSGKKESFFFCVLEYFSEEERWFLKTCQQLKEFQYPETEDSLLAWSRDFALDKIVVDFPLSMPPCYDCSLKCPGSFHCPVPEVVSSRRSLKKLLEKDREYLSENPKRYEEERKELDLRQRKEHDQILSRSFKRKLKKGFVPYWNRPLDIEIWKEFYDDLLNYFNSSFDSFGNENLIQILRFKYLDRHLPTNLKLYESNYQLCLLQLLRRGVVRKKSLEDLKTLETAVLGRMEILKSIEQNLSVFLYENDRETMIKNPRAFQSFLLTLAGRCLLEGNTGVFRNIEENFFVPQFS